MTRLGMRFALHVRRLTHGALGLLTAATLRTLRLFNPDFTSGLAGRTLRRIGPWLPEHRVGRANLTAAFPDKSPQEIDRILSGAWENLGRMAGELAHIDRMIDFDRSGRTNYRIIHAAHSVRITSELRDDGKPALIFSAHLGNWELAAAAATRLGLDTTVLYRRPNVRAVSDVVVKLRSGCMGTLVPTSLHAPLQLAEALERGSHVAMLVDQYAVQGVPVTFFGRRTRANALIARLARNIECPIHGIRVIRHPGNRFLLDLTEAITPARDADGRIDVQGTMQVITDVVESWVREHPEQWLWQHRRWRGE